MAHLEAKRATERLDGQEKEPPEAACVDPLPASKDVQEEKGGEGKVTVVRVKRKRSESAVDSLVLEVTRPTKRPYLHQSLGSLSFSTSPTIDQQCRVIEKPDRQLFKLLGTVSSEAGGQNEDLRRVLEARGGWRGGPTLRRKIEELGAAHRREKEVASRSARFEHVQARRSKPQEENLLGDLVHVYDVVRLPSEDDKQKAAAREARKRAARQEGVLMANYLPLLREYLPDAVSEVEAAKPQEEEELHTDDEFVYDVYTLEEGRVSDDDLSPLVQVVEGPSEAEDEAASDLDSEDSNAENNPDNDYPDEEDNGVRGLMEEASSGGWGSESDVDPYGNDSDEYDTVAYDSYAADGEDYQPAWARRR